MNKCCFNGKINEDLINCKLKAKYGDYCYKHRRNYLIDNDGMIINDRFTGLLKDYLRDDIIKYMKVKMKKKSFIGSKVKLFDEVTRYITILNDYNIEENKKNIIKIQSLIRRKIIKNKLINKKCNNNEDFYTFELLENIPKKYFYSYIDKGGIRWGFDIRSLEKLFQMGYSNPYTTEGIPHDIMDDVGNKINELKKKGEFEDLINIIKRDRRELIKQKTVDLFSLIEQSGYTCHVNWFIYLNIRKLKDLYKSLEDILNYRSQLSNEMKRLICPPDANIFRTPMIDVMNYNCKEDLQELILNEVIKFTKSEDDSNMKLGFMYFLAAFSEVSQDCLSAHIGWYYLMMEGVN